MIFTELRFVAAFLACWLCVRFAPRAWRSGVIAFFGLLVYALYAGPFLPVAFAFAVASCFSQHRAIAWLAGIGIVGLLAWFKMPGALVPLGFSYLAFELLHVIIERRRGRIRDLPLLDLLAFAFFAPARIAGPIRRFPDFIASVRDAAPSAEDVYAGVVRILTGLAKKFFLADLLALTAAEHTYAASMRHAWTVVLAYSFQIYLDFSAYSDIAIGFARTMGIRLPENFRWPYLAPNIRDFWDRWHITLSHWVRDYVFVPAGRALFRTALRPRPAAIAVLSYLLTFLIVGAWHGLTVAFVAWGLYHGALLGAHHVIRLKLPPRIADHPLYRSRGATAVSALVTFAFVTVGWVPFMLPWNDARRLLALMFGFTP